MPLHRGTKTATTSAVAATSFSTMFFDPTGISAVTFLSSGTAAVVGTTYHAIKGTSKQVSKAIDKKRQCIAEQQAHLLRMSHVQHVQFQCEIENTIRRLTSSFEGALIPSVLFLGLPYMGIIWAINATETGLQIRRLQTLANRVGGRRALYRTVSKRNVAVQMATGAAIKTATISVTLGHHLDAAITSIAGHVDGADSKAILTEIGDAHDKDWLQESFVKMTTDELDQPQNGVKEIFERLEGTYDGTTDAWSWDENHSIEGVVALGATVAIVNKTVDYVVDNNLHKGSEVVTGTRKKNSSR